MSSEPLAREWPHSGAQSAAVGARTAVGVDVGEATLAAAAPAHGDTDDALMIDGDHVRETFRLLRWATVTLQEFGGDTTGAETAVVAAFWRRLRGQLHDTAARVIQFAQTFPGAVLVLEELPYASAPLYEHRDTDELGTWILPALQEALVERATDAGLPVAWIDPNGTSLECHSCGEQGERGAYDDGGWHEFQCTNPDCPVDAVDADASAAVTIASRLD